MFGLRKIIFYFTSLLRYIAIIAMTLMMFFITAAVVSRLLFIPIVGDVELVQLGMVVLIMLGLAYTQQVDGHIRIDFIVEKFPYLTQKILDIFGYTLTFVGTLIIGYIYIGVANEHQSGMILSTNLLQIPYYPFDWAVVLGFFSWGLESLLKCVDTVISIFKKKEFNEG